MKISGIEEVPKEPVNWQLRTEAFAMFRKLRDARNEALHSPDKRRYQRLGRLSDLAWARYERRSGKASRGKERKPPVASGEYCVSIS